MGQRKGVGTESYLLQNGSHKSFTKYCTDCKLRGHCGCSFLLNSCHRLRSFLYEFLYGCIKIVLQLTSSKLYCHWTETTCFNKFSLLVVNYLVLQTNFTYLFLFSYPFNMEIHYVLTETKYQMNFPTKKKRCIMFPP